MSDKTISGAVSNLSTTAENFVPCYQYGWVCPKCGSVYSPTTSCCPRCAKPYEVTCTYGGAYPTYKGE